MKRIAEKIILALVILASTVGLLSPTSAETPKLVQFQMALLKQGPKPAALQSSEAWNIHTRVDAYQAAMSWSRRAVITGTLGGDSDILAVAIFRAQSADEVRTWTDPATKTGEFVLEMHPWWSEDIFKKANSPIKLETVYLGFLKKGPNRKDGDDQVPEIQELQKAHIANINRLAGLKKLIVAGPFGDDGVLRGIFVFRVSSLAEAQELCATDPMIKIDRLRVELHPWNVPEGVLP
ncbi:MAG TPA: YciI family protein [Pyrinomonadaceae bacterium]|nr:YciI family protein [Pyrinomonadaceae bacterium]